jgi:hypothetical protein
MYDTTTNRLADEMQRWATRGFPGIPVEVLYAVGDDQVRAGDTAFVDPTLTPADGDLVAQRICGRMIVRRADKIGSTAVMGVVVEVSRPMLRRPAISRR